VLVVVVVLAVVVPAGVVLVAVPVGVEVVCVVLFPAPVLCAPVPEVLVVGTPLPDPGTPTAGVPVVGVVVWGGATVGVGALVVPPAGALGVLAPEAVPPAAGTLGAFVLCRAVVAGAPAGVLSAPPAGAVLVVEVVGVVPDPPASDTSAAVNAPSESTITVASATTGLRQFGVAARRVRAAAPQRRHHSCSLSSGVPHRGQLSPLGPPPGPGAPPPGPRVGPKLDPEMLPSGPGAGPPPDPGGCGGGGGAGTLTQLCPAGG
jgi:hypothetical protein